MGKPRCTEASVGGEATLRRVAEAPQGSLAQGGGEGHPAMEVGRGAALCLLALAAGFKLIAVTTPHAPDLSVARALCTRLRGSSAREVVGTCTSGP